LFVFIHIPALNVIILFFVFQYSLADLPEGVDEVRHPAKIRIRRFNPEFTEPFIDGIAEYVTIQSAQREPRRPLRDLCASPR
jgi:hypothetical protein